MAPNLVHNPSLCETEWPIRWATGDPPFVLRARCPDPCTRASLQDPPEPRVRERGRCGQPGTSQHVPLRATTSGIAPRTRRHRRCRPPVGAPAVHPVRQCRFLQTAGLRGSRMPHLRRTLEPMLPARSVRFVQGGANCHDSSRCPMTSINTILAASRHVVCFVAEAAGNRGRGRSAEIHTR